VLRLNLINTVDVGVSVGKYQKKSQERNIYKVKVKKNMKVVLFKSILQ